MADYVESPLDRIVAVHWATPAVVVTSLSVSWSASMIAIPGDPAPLYVDDSMLMTIGTTNLPALSRTNLEVNILLGVGLSDEFWASFRDDVPVETFPDGTGTIRGSAFLRQEPSSGELSGSASYATSATSNRFGGAASISITLHATLHALFRGTGYNWSAIASAGPAGTQTLTGTASSAASLSFTATAQISPPSLIFG